MPTSSSPDPTNVLPPGSSLGRYRIVKLLSSGSMGQLYLARAGGIEGFEKQVVLKRILPHLASLAEFERMLLQEARLMASLHHPNIVQVYDADRVEQGTFFTMEYVHGESLLHTMRTAARRGRGFSLDVALWIATGIANGLHYAHDKKLPDGEPLNIIHRDVSPHNVMLSHDGAVKLIDFGVAKAVALTAHTAPETIKGNLRYMSPEQATGKPLDKRSDIFSLGIVLFELTTGTRFSRERDDVKAVERMLMEPLPRPSERRAKFPPALEEIVMTALSKRPERRLDSARALQVALEGFARDHQLVTSNVALSDFMHSLFDERAEASTEQALQGWSDTLAVPTRYVAPRVAGEGASPEKSRRPRNAVVWVVALSLGVVLSLVFRWRFM